MDNCPITGCGIKATSQAMKTCTKCGEAKSFDEFQRSAGTKDGFQYRCRDCYRAYYQENRKRIIKRVSDYQRDNAEKVSQRQRAYKRANREVVAERKRNYYQANRDRLLQKSSEYQKANPDKIRGIHSRRRARKYATVPQRWVVDHALGDSLACWWCGRGLLGAKPHLDHVHPIALGGPADLSNEVMTCQTCNTRKNAKHPLVWLAEIV